MHQGWSSYPWFIIGLGFVTMLVPAVFASTDADKQAQSHEEFMQKRWPPSCFS